MFQSGKSRGFGYVTMKDSQTIEKILQKKNHIINGKLVECKIAIPKDYINNSEYENDPNQSTVSNKIFVGGLPNNLSESNL